MGVHRRLYRSPRLQIGLYECRRAASGPDPEEWSARPEIALLLRGSFVKHAGGHAVTCDVLSAAAFNPGETYQVSHPAGGGDVCLTLTPAVPDLLEMLADARPDAGDDPERPFDGGALRVDGPAALALRLLRAALDTPGEAHVVEELAGELIARLGSPGARPHPPARRATREAHRALADAARRQLRHAVAPVPLEALARRLGCTPFHLARVFRRETGWTLHGFGTRLRLEAALERLGDGDDLSGIAAALGFADHGHLTRRFRQAYGTTPSAFRSRLHRVGRRALGEVARQNPR